MTAIASRIAAAPISWGVCEVPDWGRQLDADTVLGEMAELGLTATEFGPEGFLPDDPAAKVAKLGEFELRAVGQFVPVVLHDPDHDPLPAVQQAIDALVCAQADTVVIAAATGADGYDSRPELTEDQWITLLANLDRIHETARDNGLHATLHPHVGTMVESGEETRRVLDGSAIALCLDTGHLLIGGGDPVAIAESHPDRIGHVHLKDVRLDLADEVRAGRMTYAAAVRAGMYVPLGRGDVRIERIVHALEAARYAGWYVLEQDTMLPEEGGERGPIADVAASVNHLMRIVAH